jgi:hypothetical protein
MQLMRLVEKFIQSKTGNPETCEDGLVMTAHHIAVIDGATNKTGTFFGSLSPGRMATLLASEAIEAFDPSITATEAISAINKHIHAWYQKEGILEMVQDYAPSRCTASLVIYSDYRKELWFVGDCQALANGKSYQFQKEADRVLSDLRAMVIHVELSQGTTEEQLMEKDTSRERIVEFLKLQTKLQNSPHISEFTYHVIDGFSETPEKQVEVVPIMASTTEIVLSSDGYPHLLPTLAQTEADLAIVLKEDPLCYKRYRSTKGLYRGNLSFDDRSYIRFTL